MKHIKNTKKLLLLQLLGWGIVLCIVISWNFILVSDGVTTFTLILFALKVLPLVLIYIVNYYYLIPQFLLKGNKFQYILINICLILLLMGITYGINESRALELLKPDRLSHFRRPKPRYFFGIEFSNYVLMVGFVTAIRLAGRLKESELALKEAENARVQAELANLRSQINPHFLLNTLNNIYALTAIDTEKAQQVILDLSRLLRYVLYENKTEWVALAKEADFICNYIELMRIRLNKSVILELDITVQANSSTKVAPLMFISLVENAFKHGVSATEKSYIHIALSEDVSKHEIVLAIQNSNNPKTDSDKSGCGIGLEQVQRRLDLQYANAYSWNVECDGKIYKSRLVLKTDKYETENDSH